VSKIWVPHDNAPPPRISDLPPAKQGAVSPANIPQSLKIANAPAWVGIDDHSLSAHQPIATGPPCARESVSTAESNTELALNGMFPGMIL